MQFHLFLTCALNGEGKWLASRPGSFTKGNSLRIHRTEIWADLRKGLEVLDKKQSVASAGYPTLDPQRIALSQQRIRYCGSYI